MIIRMFCKLPRCTMFASFPAAFLGIVVMIAVCVCSNNILGARERPCLEWLFSGAGTSKPCSPWHSDYWVVWGPV